MHSDDDEVLMEACLGMFTTLVYGVGFNQVADIALRHDQSV